MLKTLTGKYTIGGRELFLILLAIGGLPALSCTLLMGRAQGGGFIHQRKLELGSN